MERAAFFKRFTSWFEPTRIVALARSTRWLIRQGKIDPFEFLVGLVFAQILGFAIAAFGYSSAFVMAACLHPLAFVTLFAFLRPTLRPSVRP